METDMNYQAAMLEHAKRQTKALENINWVLMAIFVAVLISVGIFLIF